LSEKKELWRIKHRAKWSHNLREKKEAIMELSFHGEKAIPYLEEILNAIKSKAIGTSASATAAES
jgi:transcriptional accessory protein Tex/SPT6